jgi:hypothetical protein
MDDRIDHLGFTGTRKGGTQQQLRAMRRLIGKLWPQHVHHGDCLGADDQFHLICRELHVPAIILHPPDRGDHRAFCHGDAVWPPKSYLERNRDIVDSSELMLVVPKTADEQLRSGTWATFRYAKSLKKKIIVIDPDGGMHTYRLTRAGAYIEVGTRRRQR